MLKVSLRYDDESMDAFKELIHKSFPGKDVGSIFKVLTDYDEAYFAAREYFAYYFSMNTKTVVDYVNQKDLGRIWQFITDAVFDGGINAIYRFYDKSSRKNGNILSRCLTTMGACVSNFEEDDVVIKMLTRNRNNMAAHYGSDFGMDSSRISYDAPIIILERLRRDRVAFDKKYFEMVSFLEDDLFNYFSSMTIPVTAMLGANINSRTINNELKSYIDSVIGAAEKKSLL